MSARTLRNAIAALVVGFVVLSNPQLADRVTSATRSVFVQESTPSNLDTPFYLTDPTGPVGWDTCETVRVYVNPGVVGPEAITETKEAVARVAAASGVRLVFAGTSNQVPSLVWLHDQKPGANVILVGWVAPAETDLITSSTRLGATAALPQKAGTTRRLTSAVVALNADKTTTLDPGFAAGRSRGVLLTHELAHAVGLGHSSTPGDLMYSTVDEGTDAAFSREDLTRFVLLRPSCGD